VRRQGDSGERDRAQSPMASSNPEQSDRSAAARAVTRNQEAAVKFSAGSCEELGKASIKCIEEHDYNRQDPACQAHFDAYKECRKQQNLDRRAKFPSLFG